jgi:hypothetical protein
MKKETLETKCLKQADGTIVYYFQNKMHNWESAAYIPQGNKRAAEYYLFGIKYTKDQWLEAKKDVNGVPFHKTAAGKQAGVRA